MTPDEFRRLGHRLIDWVADYRERIETLPVMSRVRPGEIRAALPKQPPQAGGGLEAALPSLDSTIVPGITHWNHPGFFAYFPSNFDLAAVLGDLVCAGLAPQGMSWQTSPAATELEEVVMDWLRQALGLSSAFTGVIHDTASTATLCALLCARERASGHSQQRGGLHGESQAFVVYASDQAHSSIEKGALLAGFGRSNLRLIATDENHALRLDRLTAAIHSDLATGRKPAAIVASIGTTPTTALDPLAQIAELAQRHGIWLHVDAAMAGTAMLCLENRWMWEGVEQADSLVLNPHKWMGTGFDLSAYYVRDVEHLIRVMSTNPSYLRTAQDGLVTNFRDWGLPLGRRMRSLRLWFLLLDQGIDGLAARVRRDVEHARWLMAQVDAAADWERLAPVPLQTVCLRHVPAALRADEQALTRHNLAIATRVNEGGRFYLTPAMLKGRQMIRVSIGSATTERRHVEALWDELTRQAREV
jgi:aromatic-L-amino-acid/L-tryptophan decarboxylase